MALDDSDRRRFFFALLVTLVAVPTLWWVSRDDAAAGEIGGNGETISTDATTSTTSTTIAPPTTVGKSNLPPPEAVESVPVFLDGPEAEIGGVTEIAVPGQPTSQIIVGEASYSRAFGAGDACLSRTITTGGTITVLNLDNNRSTTCVVSLASATQRQEIVMGVDRFAEIADLTDAPIPVEIRL